MSKLLNKRYYELFPSELHLHINRLSDETLSAWEQIRFDETLFPQSQPSFADYANVLSRVVEKGLISDPEFIWLTAKAGIITGQLNRVLDFSWKFNHPGLRAQAALALSYKGQTNEALELLKAAEREAEILAAKDPDDLEILVEINGSRAFTLTVLKKFQEAIGEYLKASQVSEPESRLEQWLQQARVRYAYSLLKLSFTSDASAVNQKVLDLANQSNDRYFKSQALNGIGHCQDRIGKTDEALEMYSQALNESESIQAINITSIILNRVGMALAWRKKDLDTSIDYFRRAIASAQEGSSSWLEFGPMANLAIVKKMKGAYFEAGELFEAVKDRTINSESGDLNDQLFAYMNLSDIYQELGDIERANESKKIAQDLARQLRNDSA
jgi:tetratricopeptide (TPR) repeat protein